MAVIFKSYESVLIRVFLHAEFISALKTEPKYGVLRKLKHIFPNTYQRIKSICSPARWDWLL